MLAFGENEIYIQVDNDKDSLLFWWQVQAKKLFGFTIPILLGRGILSRFFGWMPYRRPIDIVGALLHPTSYSRQSANRSASSTICIPLSRISAQCTRCMSQP